MTPSRYLTSADENALFTTGVTTWRLDIQTAGVLTTLLQEAAWQPIPTHKSGAPNVCENPVGVLTPQQSQQALHAVTLALNDPVLFPDLRKMGKLTPKAVELQNGAFDDAWHHDHLSNKRGHAGQFFFIVYMNGLKQWDSAWGGGFHYGERTLTENWLTTITPPKTVQTVWPTHRQALLGWNENPRLIHRAQFLQESKNRTAFLMPVDCVPHA